MCNYEPTIEVVGLPTFASHLEGERLFSLESSKAGDEGVYKMSIIATLSIPLTYEKITFDELTAQLDIDIIVADACKTSTLQEVVLEDMMVTVHGEAVSQTISEVVDLVSMRYGDKDGLSFCGTRIYEVLDSQLQHSSYLSFDERKIVTQSTNDADIGEH